jgi:hypothetical protein
MYRFAILTLAVALSGCSVDAAPPFEVTGSGSLSGIVFFDQDQNGLFDPSAGDTALSDVHVLVRARGTTSTLAGGDVQTDANGRFMVADLPVGTHSLLIDTTGLGSSVAFCNNPMPVSIYISEAQFVSVDARGGCVVSILAASAQSLGQRVTVRGTVTSSLNQISTGTAYLEDATGGIQVFSPTGPSFQIGDVIEVSGTLASFSNELELSSATVNSVSPGTPLDPVDVTAEDATAAGGDTRADLQGRLIQIRAAKLLDAFTGGGGRNAEIDDGTSTLTDRFVSHVVADAGSLSTTFTAGKCYDWTGILKAFTSPPVELFPRSLSDVKEVPCS